MKLMTTIFVIAAISFTFSLSMFTWELLSGFQFIFFTEILIRFGLICTLFFMSIFALMIIVKEMK